MSHSDLIDAHLDGSATPSDIDQLEAAIATDPTVAHELARSASVEAALAAHFAVNRSTSALITQLEGQPRSSPAPSAPPSRAKASGSPQCRVAFQATSQGPVHTPCGPSVAMPWHSRTSADRWRSGAAAVVLALGIAGAAIAWLHRSESFYPAQTATAAKPESGASAAAVSSLPRPPSFTKLGETPEMSALRRRFEGYYLTTLGLEKAVPLSQAVDRILSRARELNHLRQPAIDALSLAPAKTSTPSPAAEPLVRLPKNDFSLMDALRLVAVQAESEVRLDPPGTISLIPLPKMASSKLITRSFRVRPDFLSSRTDPATNNPFEKVDVHRNALELEQHTRQEINKFKSRLESLKDKQGEEVVAAAANFGIEEPKTAAILSAYLADSAELQHLERRYGLLHPTLQNQRQKVESERAQLDEAAESIRTTMENQLSTATSILANMEKITEETRKEAMEPRQALEEFGISFPEGTAVAFNPATSSLTVTHTEAALGQIEAFLAVDSRAVQTMINASMNVFEFSDGDALENRLMDHVRFAEWLKEQNGQAGVFLLTAPSITTRNRQNATVEIMRDVVRPPEIEPDTEHDGQFVTDWQGTRINVYPTLEGEVVHLTGSAEVRRPSDAAPGQLPHQPPASVGADLVSTAIDIDAIIPPRQTALFSLSENSEGPHLVGTITLDVIRPERPASPRGH